MSRESQSGRRFGQVFLCEWSDKVTNPAARSSESEARSSSGGLRVRVTKISGSSRIKRERARTQMTNYTDDWTQLVISVELMGPTGVVVVVHEHLGGHLPGWVEVFDKWPGTEWKFWGLSANSNEGTMLVPQCMIIVSDSRKSIRLAVITEFCIPNITKKKRYLNHCWIFLNIHIFLIMDACNSWIKLTKIVETSSAHVWLFTFFKPNSKKTTRPVRCGLSYINPNDKEVTNAERGWSVLCDAPLNLTLWGS